MSLLLPAHTGQFESTIKKLLAERLHTFNIGGKHKKGVTPTDFTPKWTNWCMYQNKHLFQEQSKWGYVLLWKNIKKFLFKSTHLENLNLIKVLS